MIWHSSLYAVLTAIETVPKSLLRLGREPSRPSRVALLGLQPRCVCLAQLIPLGFLRTLCNQLSSQVRPNSRASWSAMETEILCIVKWSSVVWPWNFCSLGAAKWNDMSICNVLRCWLCRFNSCPHGPSFLLCLRLRECTDEKNWGCWIHCLVTC